MPDAPLGADRPAARRRAARPRASSSAQAEAAGFDDLWTGETERGRRLHAAGARRGVVTERIRLGTGIVNPYTRGPAVLAQHAAALQDASGGRFVLGLGSSSNVIVERWNERPVRQAAVEGARGRRGAAPDRSRASAGRAASSSRRRPRQPRADRRRGAARQDARARGRDRRRRVHELPAAQRRARRSPRPSARPTRSWSCRFFCIPQSAEEGCRSRSCMFAALRDGAGLRRVLPLAGLGRAARPDGRGVAGRRPQARARARRPTS